MVAFSDRSMSSARETTQVGEAFFRINRETSALLIIDMQNAFLEPGALLEAPMGRNIIARLAKLIAECRNTGVPVTACSSSAFS